MAAKKGEKNEVNEYGLGVREDAIEEDGSYTPLHEGKEREDALAGGVPLTDEQREEREESARKSAAKKSGSKK